MLQVATVSLSFNNFSHFVSRLAELFAPKVILERWIPIKVHMCDTCALGYVIARVWALYPSLRTVSILMICALTEPPPSAFQLFQEPGYFGTVHRDWLATMKASITEIHAKLIAQLQVGVCTQIYGIRLTLLHISVAL